MHDLKDKVAIICGGAGYLGLPVCQKLSELGSKVIIADVSDEGINKALEEVPGALGFRFDISEEQSIEDLVNFAIDQYGKIDILVIATANHAGPDFMSITSEEFSKALHSNVTGTFMMIRYAAEKMNQGSIVTYSSMYGDVVPDFKIYDGIASPNPIEYGAAKAAIVQITKYCAAQYGPKGIRVNSVMPGPFLKNPDDHPEFAKRLAEKTVLNRVGKQHETAGAVAFLASDLSSYITGHILKIDGGWTIR